ncbi:MAG: YopX family protein [Candidatus Scalindua sp.]
MRYLKFRQPIFGNGKFNYWHYWGHLDKGFTVPANADLNKESQEFIGLQDKNGKDIYEGDICRILYTDWPSQAAEKNGRYSMSLDDYKKSISSIMVVKFFAPSFWLCRNNDACSSMNPGKHGELEIIGNIYENKDLLEAAS